MTRVLPRSSPEKDNRDLRGLTSRSSRVLQLLGKLKHSLFGISPEEATVAKREFQVDHPQIQKHLETIGQTFLKGYHAAIEDPRPECLIPCLETVADEWRGFAYEGAAMGLALLDGLTPWQRNRLPQFLADAGDKHVYMAYVGLGWALARLPWGVGGYIEKLEQEKGQFPDRLLGWLALDGYGFHQGYFYWPQYVEKTAQPKNLSGYADRVFNQGLGRSLWFVCGADIDRITRAIAKFPSDKRGDLWSGIGLACTYAGGADKETIQSLHGAVGAYLPQLSQGAAFAAKARQRAGNPIAHTEMACQILCGISAEAAAEITDRALANLSPNRGEPAYEIWRQRIQAHFTGEEIRG